LGDLKEKENDLSVVGFQNISEEMDKIKLRLENNKKYVEEILDHNDNPDQKVLKFMLKAPDQGTLETLRVQIHKIIKLYPDIKVQMLSASVGGVAENDVRCALHFKCMLFTMDVPIQSEAMIMAKKQKLVLKSSRLIFGITDELKKMLKELNENTSPSSEQTMKGTAEIGNVFEISISRTGKFFIKKKLHIYFLFIFRKEKSGWMHGKPGQNHQDSHLPYS